MDPLPLTHFPSRAPKTTTQAAKSKSTAGAATKTYDSGASEHLLEFETSVYE